MNIPADVITVLKAATCDGKQLKLNGQLERKLYQSTMKVLELLGGKWDRKSQTHVFDEEPEQGIALAIMTGTIVDFKKLFQIFETPDKVADLLVEQADINPTHVILEPSAGRGAFIRAISRAMREFKNKPSVFWCEMHDKNAEHLAKEFGRDELCRDFLNLGSGVKFNRVIMNPPFRNGQDIQHVRKAYDHLLPDGRLVAVTYPSWQWRTEKKYEQFRDWLRDRAHEVEELPAGSFYDSGTEIQTLMLTIDKS